MLFRQLTKQAALLLSATKEEQRILDKLKQMSNNVSQVTAGAFNKTGLDIRKYFSLYFKRYHSVTTFLIHNRK